jgi:hypothetical protein
MTTLFLLTNPRFAKKDKIKSTSEFFLVCDGFIIFLRSEDFTPPDAYGPTEYDTPETDFLEKITI